MIEKKKADDYFAGEQHATRLAEKIAQESERLRAVGEQDIFKAITDATGMIFAAAQFYKTIGLKNVAIEILKGCLKFMRTGKSV